MQENLPQEVDQQELEYQIYCEDDQKQIFKAVLSAKNISEVKEKIAPKRLIGAFGIKKGE